MEKRNAQFLILGKTNSISLQTLLMGQTERYTTDIYINPEPEARILVNHVSEFSSLLLLLLGYSKTDPSVTKWKSGTNTH